MSKYHPRPIDTSKIEIPQDLLALADTLARNVHETWALERITQGWEYGTERNDAKKFHPCLVPYDDLPEEEKKFDHITAMETIKVILGLGYEIRKTEGISGLN
ncbi:MAG: RyR domain-containing protein [Lentimicrobium sp.]|jgi:ryanodine receptor 2|nr:RyR domain-containing protein [Lentimicrobium sp.]